MLLIVIAGLFGICFMLWAIVSFVIAILDKGNILWFLSAIISLTEGVLLSSYVDYQNMKLLIAALVILLAVGMTIAIICFWNKKAERNNFTHTYNQYESDNHY